MELRDWIYLFLGSIIFGFIGLLLGLTNAPNSRGILFWFVIFFGIGLISMMVYQSKKLPSWIKCGIFGVVIFLVLEMASSNHYFFFLRLISRFPLFIIDKCFSNLFQYFGQHYSNYSFNPPMDYLQPSILGWIFNIISWMVLGTFIGLVYDAIKNKDKIKRVIIFIIIVGIILLIVIFLNYRNIKEDPYNVKEINQDIKQKIHISTDCSGDLPCDNKRAGIYYSQGLFEIKMGQDYGIAFVIKNIKNETSKFSWKVIVNDDNIKVKCGITDDKALNWISSGQNGQANIVIGQEYVDLIRFNIPKQAVDDVSKCIIRFQLVISNEDGTPYSVEPFDVQVK